MSDVLVLNASDEELATVPWQRAVTMVVSGMAEIHEAVEGKILRSKNYSIPFPKVIKLIRRVFVTRSERKSTVCSKKGVLRRDNWTCVYCNRSATTVDHILPRSRGGLTSWDNLAACCVACNSYKDNRTPEEAGLRLQWIPAAPTLAA